MPGKLLFYRKTIEAGGDIVERPHAFKNVEVLIKDFLEDVRKLRGGDL